MDRGVSRRAERENRIRWPRLETAPENLDVSIQSNLTTHSVHRSHPLSGSGNDCHAENLKTLGGMIFKKFLAEKGILNNRGFQCTVLSLTTSNFKMEVERTTSVKVW